MINQALFPYEIGALLYCPANSKTIVTSLVKEEIPRPFSLALCLEDTIADEHVPQAMQQVSQSIRQLHLQKKDHSFYMPNLFVRVRAPQQIQEILTLTGQASELITGFIAPKFSLDNAPAYVSIIAALNQTRDKPLYFMPVLESAEIVHLERRASVLYGLKEQLEPIQSYVPNIRVGGNDFCHLFGIRRNCNESIHELLVIAQIFADILTVFSQDYLVSGPVWEYYGGTGWDSGLARELSQDKRSGFIGKTVIHPKQIPLVNQAYQVTQEDYDDACAILGWDKSQPTWVSGSVAHSRMNECKTHSRWAMRILSLAQTYGIQTQGESL